MKVIEALESRVKKLLQDFTQEITQGEINDLSQCAEHQKPKRKNQHQEVPPTKKKHPYSGRVGQTADMI